ncbi:hypothetical protein MIS46_04270 [Wielerella bovis]|uniref:hypothetical protein n=1 Tax=Wielerella bovis TaxID=2917790 RepID=UPI002018E968|nr:hypothetical protein [Wielerella bovis]ULJ63271.1 hypothetical protein MIS46_04270 [Wielerella bovis]
MGYGDRKMMTYREHAHRALMLHHAKMECFLAKIREQEPLVNAVNARLTHHKIPFQFVLTPELDAQFWLSKDVSGSLKQLFEWDKIEPTPRGFVLLNRDETAEVEVIYHADI